MKTCSCLKAALRCSDILGQMVRDGDIEDPITQVHVLEALAAVGDAEDINPDACPWRNGITPGLLELTRDVSWKCHDLYQFLSVLEGEAASSGGVTRTSGEVIDLFRRFTPWLIGSLGGKPYAVRDGEETNMLNPDMADKAVEPTQPYTGPYDLLSHGEIDRILTRTVRLAFAVRQWEMEPGEEGRDKQRVLAVSYLADIRELCDHIEASMPLMVGAVAQKAP